MQHREMYKQADKTAAQKNGWIEMPAELEQVLRLRPRAKCHHESGALHRILIFAPIHAIAC